MSLTCYMSICNLTGSSSLQASLPSQLFLLFPYCLSVIFLRRVFNDQRESIREKSKKEQASKRNILILRLEANFYCAVFRLCLVFQLCFASMGGRAGRPGYGVTEDLADQAEPEDRAAL